jgi:RNA polymerase sigma factor (TIGR02999 family)
MMALASVGPQRSEESISAERDITRLLRAERVGVPDSMSEIFSLVYEQLTALAHTRRLQWDGDYTLDTTALVHEAYLKLVRSENRNWQDRAHFFAVASRAMRHILINYAEHRRAQKRGGGKHEIPLDDANPVAPEAAEELLALNDALDRLEAIEPRHRQVVECRFFAGLTAAETAEALGVSSRTVERDWALALIWLRRELRDDVSAFFRPRLAK